MRLSVMLCLVALATAACGGAGTNEPADTTAAGEATTTTAGVLTTPTAATTTPPGTLDLPVELDLVEVNGSEVEGMAHLEAEGVDQVVVTVSLTEESTQAEAFDFVPAFLPFVVPGECADLDLYPGEHLGYEQVGLADQATTPVVVPLDGLVADRHSVLVTDTLTTVLACADVPSGWAVAVEAPVADRPPVNASKARVEPGLRTSG